MKLRILPEAEAEVAEADAADSNFVGESRVLTRSTAQRPVVLQRLGQAVFRVAASWLAMEALEIDDVATRPREQQAAR